MCIMLTSHEPDTTKLIHLPVLLHIDGKDYDYNLCIYVNNLDIDNGMNRMMNFNSALMIVPFPKSNKPIAMMDISTKNMKRFRQDVVSLMPKPRSKGMYFNALSDSLGCDKSLKVHEIGNYNISIAPNLKSLNNNVDWSKFTKPMDFNERVNTLRNKNLYPIECVYVVAQAVENVKDDGFGILYENRGFDYFPTAHEGNGLVSYDVECYHFTNLKAHGKVPFSGHEIKSYVHDDTDNVKEILSRLSTTVTLEDGSDAKLKKVCPKRVNMWKIEGQLNNRNMYLKNELKLTDI
uniref:Uncharacterized protein n=1 Tax=viral metagenome TaxID=1070528 RepID=A0A6C0ECW6_9ZZZZ